MIREALPHTAAEAGHSAQADAPDPSTVGDVRVEKRGRRGALANLFGVRSPSLAVAASLWATSLSAAIALAPAALAQLPSPGLQAGSSAANQLGAASRLGSREGADAEAGDLDSYAGLRRSMIDSQVRRRGVNEKNLLSAMQEVPRHLFVPEEVERLAYEDRPVEIAPGQNLSQAYLSARMISLLDLEPGDRVLEVGTGSGYDAALLSQLARDVYTIEIDPAMGGRARANLDRLGYDNVHVRIGDGYRGWPEKAPFDAILLTAAPQRVPEPLFEQLAIGGKLVVAVGYSLHQDLQVITKTGPDERQVRRVSLISLAPMTGEVEQRDRRRD